MPLVKAPVFDVPSSGPRRVLSATRPYDSDWRAKKELRKAKSKLDRKVYHGIAARAVQIDSITDRAVQIVMAAHSMVTNGVGSLVSDLPEINEAGERVRMLVDRTGCFYCKLYDEETSLCDAEKMFDRLATMFDEIDEAEVFLEGLCKRIENVYLIRTEAFRRLSNTDTEK